MSRARTTSQLRDVLSSKIEADPFGGCWLWVGELNPHGYGLVNQDGKRSLAHRVAFHCFVEPIGKGASDHSADVIMHICDVRCCINPSHLRRGTQLENVQDRNRKGRTKTDMTRQGDRHPLAKLSNDDIHNIRNLIECGFKQKEIAKIYSINQSSVSMIKNRRIWGHIR